MFVKSNRNVVSFVSFAKCVRPPGAKTPYKKNDNFFKGVFEENTIFFQGLFVRKEIFFKELFA